MKIIFCLLISSLLILSSCNNQNTRNLNNDKTYIELSENEEIYNYDMLYLVSDSGEYINTPITYNTSNLGIITYTDSNQNSIQFDITEIWDIDEENIDEVSFTAVSYDNKTIEGNLPSNSYPYLFNVKIDNKEITFKTIESPITGAEIIEYLYTNSNNSNDNIFEYKNSIFVLNNPNNLKSVNKINLDINKEFEITDEAFFNNLALSIKTKDIISNKMNNYYNECKDFDYIIISKDSSKYGINYLSEKFISINRFIYEYTGGAHGNYATIYSVYSLDNGDKLQIEDLITDLKNTNLINLVKDKLVKIEGRDESSYFDLNELSLENNNFYITSKGLVFTFGIYEISPYSEGETRVLISGEEIKPYLKDEYKTIF